MPNSRHSSLIGSPSSRRTTKRIRSSITEHSFHGIDTSRMRSHAGGVTYVSGTECHPCLGPLTPEEPPDGGASKLKSAAIRGGLRNKRDHRSLLKQGRCRLLCRRPLAHKETEP